MVHHLKFPKQERLSARTAIQNLFKNGKRISVSPLRCIYVIRSAEEGETEVPVQAGFSVSKRYVKSAVKRNRIKRLLRESYRLEKNTLFKCAEKAGVQVDLFFLYQSSEIPKFEGCKPKISSLINRLQEQIQDHDKTL